MSKKKKSQVNLDGYASFLDSAQPGSEGLDGYVRNRRLGEEELAAVYEDDAIAARIVDRRPDDATRAEFDLIGLDSNYNWKATRSRLDDLEALEHVGDAWRYARLFGGSLLVLAADDGRPYSEPLDLARVRALRGLTVLDSTQVYPADIDLSLGTQGYRRPRSYQIVDGHLGDQQPGSRRSNIVHCSRVIRFDGVRVPARSLARGSGWGPSVLQRCWGSLSGYRTALAQALAIGKRLSMLVLKMANWRQTAMAGPEEQAKLRDALRELFRGMNAHNLLALDSLDDIVEIKRSIEGVAGLVDIGLKALVADSDATSQIITGEQTSTGLNSDTKGERRSWYDTVTSSRRGNVERPLDRVLEVEFAAQRNAGMEVPSEWHYTWESLERPAEADVADLATKWAGVVTSLQAALVLKPHESLQILIDRGVIELVELEAAKALAPAPTAPIEIPGSPAAEVAPADADAEAEAPNEVDLAWESAGWDPGDLYTAAEIAGLLGIPTVRITALHRAGEIRGVKLLGGKAKFSLREVKAIIIEANKAADSLKLDDADETKRCAVVVQLPDAIARLFPYRPGKHAGTPPHVTILHCGRLTAIEWQSLRLLVADLTADWKPVRARLGGLGYFDSDDEQVVWVGVEFLPALEGLRESLVEGCRLRGIPVEHHPGPWVPHATICEVDLGETYAGTLPSGEWVVERVSIWYGEDRG